MLRSMNRLEGFTIGATDGDIGKVKGFLFDDASFTVRYVVVDTGGWLAERKVLISPISLGAIDWKQGRITATLTKAQVEECPEIETDQPTWRQSEADYFSYYGYPPYWTGPYLWGPSPYPGPMQPEASRALERERPWNWETREADDSSLRDSSEVIGYYIQATDGDLGHVEDFLVDDQSWTIRYMIVDTRNWLPGKKMLVSPQWIERVDWNDEKVYVSLTREQIQNSPEYDPSRPVEREYETQLYGHYGRPTYWGDDWRKAA
jgi:PRC-barrel domain protein